MRILQQGIALARGRAMFRRALCFGTVGIGGTVLNTVLLWLLVRQSGWPVIAASALATEAAVIHNFVLNDAWTFRNAAREHSRMARLLRFNGVSLGGVCLTVAVVYSATRWLHLGLIPANLLASAVTVSWNFVANSRWTWSRQAAVEQSRAISMQ